MVLGKRGYKKILISEYSICTRKTISDVLKVVVVTDLHGEETETIINLLQDVNPKIIAIVGEIINGNGGSYPMFFSVTVPR